MTTCCPPRRGLLHAAGAGLLMGAAGLLGGCGFALRQPVQQPYRRIALLGFATRSPMAEALRQALAADVQLLPSPQGAEVVVTALEDRVYRTVAAYTATGQVRELRLRVYLKFRLSRPDGTVLLPETELEKSRDLSYSEEYALAKEVEEAGLTRAMRNDMAQQLLRMLAASRQPGGA